MQSSEIKVIDLAMKYGYESADSFTRAFTKQHDVTPTATRQSGVFLKIFPPLTFQIKIKGVGPDMEIYGVANNGKYFEEVWIPVIKK